MTAAGEPTEGPAEVAGTTGEVTDTGDTGDTTGEPTPVDPEDKRARGLAMMAQVYGWEVQDGPGDFFSMTVEHLFGEVWSRDGLSLRDRRLLLIGLLVGQGLDDVLGLQLEAALGNGEIDEDELREIVLFLTHYAGWPRGAKLNSTAEALIARRAAAAAQAAAAAEPPTPPQPDRPAD
ncbi:MAG TPA: carboxymuconolactone decarboxylase family protein [Acidimicrobiales bacterium]